MAFGAGRRLPRLLGCRPHDRPRRPIPSCITTADPRRRSRASPVRRRVPRRAARRRRPAGVGALYAYDQQYVGRILPGVSASATSTCPGSTPAAAARAAPCRVRLPGRGPARPARGTEGDRSIPYADIGRGPDVEAMVAEAMAVGRDGNAVDRAVADARTALRGVALTPRLTFDAGRPGRAYVAYRRRPGASSRRMPRSPSSTRQVRGRARPSIGRLADAAGAGRGRPGRPGRADAPAQLTYEMPVRAVPAGHHDRRGDRRQDGRRTDRARRITLAVDEARSRRSPAPGIRSWLTLRPDADGGYGRGRRHQRSPRRTPQEARQEDRPRARQCLVHHERRQGSPA